MKLLIFIFLIILGIVGMSYQHNPENNTLRDAIDVIGRNIAIIDTELDAAHDCFAITETTHSMNNPTCDDYIDKMNTSMQATAIGLLMMSNLQELGFVVKSDPYYNKYLDAIKKLDDLTQIASNINQAILTNDLPEEPKIKM